MIFTKSFKIWTPLKILTTETKKTSVLGAPQRYIADISMNLEELREVLDSFTIMFKKRKIAGDVSYSLGILRRLCLIRLNMNVSICCFN